jgi:myo-inositol-1(or 4)-monophosphatase
MPLPPPEALLETAIEAARLGGAILKEGYGKALTITTKSHARDLVTQIDTASERAVLGCLGERWPSIGLLAEETGRTRPSTEATWIVDPLDGTTNFTHTYPVFSVSIGCVDRAGPLVGVILDPLRDELFTAIRGAGAFLDGKRLRVSDVQDLGAGIFSTGLPYFPPEARRLGGEVFTEVVLIARDARRSGSAAIDLAYVAAGRSEAHYELNLSPHDVAAGLLLVSEAGGRYEAMVPPNAGGWPKGLVASNGHLLHEQLIFLVAAPQGLVRLPFSFESVFAP